MFITYLSDLRATIIEFSGSPSFAFCPERVNFLSDLASDLRHSTDPQFQTFSYFLRHKLLKYDFSSRSSIITGRGLSIHYSPGNVPLNALYTWAVSFAAGNNNIVKLSTRSTESDLSSISPILRSLAASFPYECFVLTDDYANFTQLTAPLADTRLIWGTNETIKNVKSVPSKHSCLDIPFSSKNSTLLLNLHKIPNRDSASYRHFISALASDLFFSNNHACTSPSTIFLYTNLSECDIQSQLSVLLKDAHLASVNRYPWSLSNLSDKILYLNKLYCEEPNTHVIHIAETPISYTYNASKQFKKTYWRHFNIQTLKSLPELLPHFDNTLQSISSFGFDQAEILSLLRERPVHLRTVPLGQIHTFSLTWDGYNLPAILTCNRTVL